MKSLKKWLSFVNNSPTCAQKLPVIIISVFGYGGRGLQLEKVGQLFQVLPVYFGEVAKKLLWFILSRSKTKNIFFSEL